MKNTHNVLHKPMKQLLTMAAAMLVAVLACVSARAEIVINTPGTPVTITFDQDVAGVVQMRTGSGGQGGVTEPDHWWRSPWNNNRPITFCSEGVTISYEWSSIFGRGNGVCGYFGNDANNDGDTGDAFGGTTAPRPEVDALGSGNNAARLSSIDWANTRTIFRIRNNSGGTLGQWIFAFDLHGGANNNNATVSYKYAVSNTNDPEAMTFTTMGTVPIPNNGGSVEFIGTIGATVDVSVANASYIVLSLEGNRGGGQGSLTYVNDLSVTGIVPEPGVIGLAALALVALRRK